MPRPQTDERAAVRAFLQRAEVRLSTVHRVATALLSGAGLMVLLPAIARDSVTTVMSRLLASELTAPHLALVGALSLVLVLPFVALWLLLRDLTRFYFHAQHLRHGGSELFTPRFTLTGLRMPVDELDAEQAEALDAARRDPSTVELLVPSNENGRRRVDAKLDAYGLRDLEAPTTDTDRAAGLFELSASRERTLIEEVAKIEHGMARHMLRLQVVVLRYVKALLAFLCTALAVFAASGVVEHDPSIATTSEVWLAAIVAVWSGVVVAAVTSPVRWIEQLLRSEGAAASGVAADHELTRVERVSVWIAVAAWSLAAAVVVMVALDDASTTRQVLSGVIVVGTTAVVGGVILAQGRSTARRA